MLSYISFFFYGYGDPQDLPVLPHSFPTLRASDLAGRVVPASWRAFPRRGGLRCAAAVRGDRRCDPGGVLAHLPGAEMAQRRTHAGSRSEEHTSELQSLMRISYAVFCLKKKIRKRSGDRSEKQTASLNSLTRTAYTQILYSAKIPTSAQTS